MQFGGAESTADPADQAMRGLILQNYGLMSTPDQNAYVQNAMNQSDTNFTQQAAAADKADAAAATSSGVPGTIGPSLPGLPGAGEAGGTGGNGSGDSKAKPFASGEMPMVQGNWTYWNELGKMGGGADYLTAPDSKTGKQQMTPAGAQYFTALQHLAQSNPNVLRNNPREAAQWAHEIVQHQAATKEYEAAADRYKNNDYGILKNPGTYLPFTVPQWKKDVQAMRDYEQKYGYASPKAANMTDAERRQFGLGLLDSNAIANHIQPSMAPTWSGPKIAGKTPARGLSTDPEQRTAEIYQAANQVASQKEAERGAQGLPLYNIQEKQNNDQTVRAFNWALANPGDPRSKFLLDKMMQGDQTQNPAELK
jgi:hypothetical protein